MATQTVTQSKTQSIPQSIGVVQTDPDYPTLEELGKDLDNPPEWLQHLKERGWAIVPGVISPEKAQGYVDRMHDWLEKWGIGYNRNDPSTRFAKYLPWHSRGGLYNRYGIGHEQFVWDIKSEPALINTFEMLWGTQELVVSYDGVNMSIPDVGRPKTDPAFVPWAHVDQSPLRRNLQCVQGILNLLPNGPEDGGLMVLDKSNAYYTELWEHFDDKKGPNGWNTIPWQTIDEDMNSWLLAKGCTWTKLCPGPGDLMLWDSRTIHYGAVPSSTNDRFAAYVCYKPAKYISEEVRRGRLEAFNKKQNTAHDPSVIRIPERQPPEDHETYEAAKKLQEPVLTRRARQLAGLEPY